MKPSWNLYKSHLQVFQKPRAMGDPKRKPSATYESSESLIKAWALNPVMKLLKTLYKPLLQIFPQTLNPKPFYTSSEGFEPFKARL